MAGQVISTMSFHRLFLFSMHSLLLFHLILIISVGVSNREASLFNLCSCLLLCDDNVNLKMLTFSDDRKFLTQTLYCTLGVCHNVR